MKYAIHGPAGRIQRVVDEEPVGRLYTQITDEQATTIEQSSEKNLFLKEGVLLTLEEIRAEKISEGQASRMQAIVDKVGDQIRQLEAIVDFFGLTRPVSFLQAISEIEAWQQVKIDANDTMAVAQANVKSQKMTLLFQVLKEAGLDETIINSVWTFMGETNQQ